MKSFEFISEIALTLISSSDFAEQMNLVIRKTGEYLKVSRVYIFMDDYSQTTTSNEYEWCGHGIKGLRDNLQNIPYDAIPSLKEMLREEKLICSEDVQSLPDEIKSLMYLQDVHALVVYPIYVENMISGFIGFDECQKGRKWSSLELNLLKTISGLISGSYERKITQQRLESTGNNFKSFFNTVDDLFIIGNMKGDIVYANDAVIRKLGYSREELRKMKIIQLHPESKREKAAAIIKAMFEEGDSYCPLELEDRSGRIIPVETRVWLGEWDREPCIFGISKDLSREQDALQKFTKIFENNPAIMAISRMPEGIIAEVNESFQNKLGYLRDEVIGKRVRDLELSAEPEKREMLARLLLESGKIKNAEVQMRCGNGEILHGLFSAEVVESQGEKYSLAVMVDITEQINLKRSVDNQKRRLENIIESTQLGTWEWNIGTGEVIINSRWAEIAGYGLDELLPFTVEDWMEMVYQEDVKNAGELMRRHFNGETDYYEIESRIKHKDGSLVWVHDKGKVIEWNQDGDPLWMFGIHMDISTQKLNEHILRETEKRFDLALNGTGAGLWDWDMVNNTVYFSPLWKSMLGYQDDEVENAFDGWKRLWHPDDAPLIEKAIKDYLDGKKEKYEIAHRLLHKNGQWRWILTRGGLLKDKEGKPYRWVGTNIDITLEKERSNELERFFSVNLDLLCIADNEGNFIKVNKAWTDILGYSVQELESRKFLDFVHPDDIKPTLDAMSRLSDQEKVLNFINRYRHSNGSYRYVEWRSYPYGRLIYAAARDITERIEYEKRLQEISIRDSLTGIFNRRYVFERLDSLLSEYRRNKKIFSVTLMDIDHFKNINDRYGHQAGDFILKEFTKLISLNLRPYDLLGRYGGEEIIVISADEKKDQAMSVMERIRELTENTVFKHNNAEIKFTFSCGISDSTEAAADKITVEKLIEKADNRLYLAKKTGRNKILAEG